MNGQTYSNQDLAGQLTCFLIWNPQVTSTKNIVNKKGLLEYKNRVSEDHPIFLKLLKDDIRNTLDNLNR